MFRHVLARLLLTLCLLISLTQLTHVSAQEAPSNLCEDVRYLMEREITPAALFQSGSDRVIHTNATVTGDIGKDDLGDFWVFGVAGSDTSTRIAVHFSNLPDNVELEFALFEGTSRVQTENGSLEYQSTTENSVIFDPKHDGIYTLSVRMKHVSDLAVVSNDDYNISVDFPEDLAFDPRANDLLRYRDNDGSLSTQSTYEEGSQLIPQFPRTGAQVRFPLGSLSGRGNDSLNISSSNGTRLLFTSADININSWATEVDYRGGNLSVVSDEILFYLDYFDPPSTPTNYGDLNRLTDAIGTQFTTDWRDISGIWILRDCVGFKRTDGITFVIPLNPVNPERYVDFSTQTNGCLNTTIGVTTPVVIDGQSRDIFYNLCMVFDEAVAPNSLVSIENGILSAILVGERYIRLQPPIADTMSVAILPLNADSDFDDNYENSGDLSSVFDSFPVQIHLGDQIVIRLDWVNMVHFTLENGQISLRYNDPIRENNDTQRSADGLQLFEALDDVIVIRYENQAERLILPESESYLEIVTPSGDTPLFDGQAFNGTALPGTPGYQPRSANNLGAECYPVNTMLDILNCDDGSQVNPANGNIGYSVTDLIAYAPGANLTLTRRYNSGGANIDGAFGLGWTSPYAVDYNVPFDPVSNSRLVDFGNFSGETEALYPVALDLTWASRGLVEFRAPSGSRHAFIQESPTLYRALNMPGWTLLHMSRRDGWVLSQLDGYELHFDRSGRLREMHYAQTGRILTIEYPWETNLYGPMNSTVIVTDGVGLRQLELTYNDQHHIVHSVLRDLSMSHQGDACSFDQNCLELQYEYEGNLLVQVTYSDGQIANYDYDAANRLRYHNDPYAPVASQMGYVYAENGSVTAYILTGDTNDSLSSDNPAIIDANNIVDGNGQVIAYLWREVAVCSPDQCPVTTERTVAIQDDLHNITQYKYKQSTGKWDVLGDSFTLASVAHPMDVSDGFANPEIYSWIDWQMTGISGRGGQQDKSGRNALNFVYSEVGKLTGVNGGYPGFSAQFPTPNMATSVSFADAGTLTYTYKNGQIETYTDSAGLRYEYHWSETVPMRLESLKAYDRGPGLPPTIYSYEYDENSMVSAITRVNDVKDDPGYRVAYTWDALGRLIRIEDDVLGVYTIQYLLPQQNDNRDVVSEIKVIDPVSAVTLYRFDGRGRLIEQHIAVKENDLQRSSYTYDVFDRMTSEIRWLDANPLSTNFSYVAVPLQDGAGNTVVDGQGTAVNGWQVTITDAAQRTSSALYDARGRVRQMSSWQSDVVRTFEYSITDVKNNIRKTSLSNGLRIVEQDKREGTLVAQATYAFDLHWRLLYVERQVYDVNGGYEQAWELFGSQLDPNNGINVRQLDALGLTMQWTEPYANGLPLQTKLSSETNGSTVWLAYDSLGHATRIGQTIDKQELVTCVTYAPDIQGQYNVTRMQGILTTQEDTCGLSETSLTYDVHDRLIGIRDEFGSRSFSYEANSDQNTWNIMLKADDYQWQFTYDALGQLIRWVNDQQMTREYSYDMLGRLIAVVTTLNGEIQPEVSFTFIYNDANLLVQVIDQTGRGNLYDYNKNGQLLLQQDISTSNAVVYTYNQQGLLSSVVSPLGGVTAYEYDGGLPNHLRTIITAAGQHNFNWDTSTNQMIYTSPLGQETQYLYNAFGLIEQIEQGTRTDDVFKSGTSYQFDYNDLGSLLGWQIVIDDEIRSLTLTPDVQTHRYDVTQAETPNYSWSFDFSPSGMLEWLRPDPKHELGFKYDPLGRLSEVLTDHEGETWLIDREPDSNTLTYTDGFLQKETLLTFDAQYRLIDDQTHSYQYSPDKSIVTLNIVRTGTGTTERLIRFNPGTTNNTASIEVIMPGRCVIYSYDAEGKLAAITTRVQNISSSEGLSQDGSDVSSGRCPNSGFWSANFRFDYDVQGRLTRIIDSNQNVETFNYDAVSRLIGYQNFEGQSYTYSYDTLNRLTSIISSGGTRLVMGYSFENVIGVCQTDIQSSVDYAICAAEDDGAHILERYEYDGLGRMQRRVFDSVGLEQAIQFAYDQGTQLTGWQIGVGSSEGPKEVTLTYTDDGLGLLHTLDIESGSNYTLQYGSLGQVSGYEGDGATSLTGEAGVEIVQGFDNGSLIYTYKEDGRSYTVQQGDAEITYTYLPNGLLGEIHYRWNGTDEVSISARYPSFDDVSRSVLLDTSGDDRAEMELEIDRLDKIIAIVHNSLNSENLTTSYTFDNLEQVLRQTIETRGNQHAYYQLEASGYGIVIGYDASNRPLTLRVNEEASTKGARLLYLQTLAYNSDGQLENETRQYADGTRIVIHYEYANGNQLIRRIVQYDSENAADASVVFITLSLSGLSMAIVRRRRVGVLIVMLVIGGGFSIIWVPDLQAQTDLTGSFVYEYLYNNAGSIREVAVTANGDIQKCATYTYDAANRLVDVKRTEDSTHYDYDLYGRVTLINNQRQLIYQDASRIPFASVSNGNVQYLIEMQSGLGLFLANEGEIASILPNGQQGTYGVQTDEQPIDPIWLFDPLGRFLTLEAPSLEPEDICNLFAPSVNISQRLDMSQSVYDGMIWSAESNLYFNYDGRVYSPEAAHFLQRDPLGPDASGNLYNYPSRQVQPPVQVKQPIIFDGLQILDDAFMNIQSAQGVDTEAVMAMFMPSPTGFAVDPLGNLLSQSESLVHKKSANMTTLPHWLAQNYNLPMLRIQNGRLEVPLNNAPGQGGWGDEEPTWDSAQIWQNAIWMPTPITQDYLSSLVNYARPELSLPITYVSDAWQGHSLQLSDIWQLERPSIDIANTPASVLSMLPISFANYGAPDPAVHVLNALQYNEEPSAASEVENLLAQALPQTPALPSAGADAWRNQLFSEDVLGIARFLSNTVEFAPPLSP
jgi:YD repeat-containing protein